MSSLDEQEQALRIELMMVQIDKDRLDIERIRQDIERSRQEMRWEPYKAVAVILAGAAAMTGVILAVAHIIH